MKQYLFLTTLIWIFSCSAIVAQSHFKIIGQNKISDSQGNFSGKLGSNDLFGMAAVSIGDLNNDGIEDIAVSAPWDDDGGTDRGAVYILFMGSDDKVKSYKKINSATSGFTGVLSNGSYWGFGLAYLGDVNNDGNIELAVGAATHQFGGIDDGAVYILSIDTGGNIVSYTTIADGKSGFSANIDNESFGYSVANIGDINGDGITDIAVGARNSSIGGTKNGAVYIIFLDTNLTVKGHKKVNEGTQNFTSNLPDYGYFGTSITGIGDVNNDGYADIAVGAFGDGDGGANRGAVYIIFLDNSGSVAGYQKISSTHGNFSNALTNNDRFGRSVRAIPDLNGDNRKELAVGAPNDANGGTNRGAFYVLYLDTTGSVDYYEKIVNSREDVNIALDNDDTFGESLGLIETSGLGSDKLIVGATRDDDGGLNFGAIYLLTFETPTSTGISKKQDFALKLYPNPVTTSVSIVSAQEIKTASVFNTLGQKVLHFSGINSSEFNLDLSKLRSGTYYISLEGDNFKVMKPLIKN